MSVVKRAVQPAALPPPRSLDAGEADLEAGAPSHFVSPGHVDQAARNLWIVGFILACVGWVGVVS